MHNPLIEVLDSKTQSRVIATWHPMTLKRNGYSLVENYFDRKKARAEIAAAADRCRYLESKVRYMEAVRKPVNAAGNAAASLRKLLATNAGDIESVLKRIADLYSVEGPVEAETRLEEVQRRWAAAFEPIAVQQDHIPSLPPLIENMDKAIERLAKAVEAAWPSKA